MMFFFKNPILAKIEEAIWKEAGKEIEARVQRGELEPKKLAGATKDLFKGLWSAERAKAKMAIRTYTEISKSKTGEALNDIIEVSDPSFYSVEIVDSETKTPRALAVPYPVVLRTVSVILRDLLSKRIEFKSMRESSVNAFAEEAAEKFLEDALANLLKSGKRFQMNLPCYRSACLVEILRKDWYYLGERTEPSRVDIVIFADYQRADWRKMRENVDFRPPGRRFTVEALSKWGLESSYFETMDR
jgi:hypothetical protein